VPDTDDKQGKFMRDLERLMVLVVLIAAASTAQTAPGGNGDIAQLGFRGRHRCVLHDNGAVDCVSESPYLDGPLGNNPAYRPVRMAAHGATQLSVGGFASCAIVAGALDCWQALPATGKMPAAPERLIVTGVTDVSVGDDHACAVTHGAALCWGGDFEGQVGHNDGTFGDGTKQIKPWPVIAKGVSRVAAGGDRSCAVVEGALWCWGNTGLASDPHFKDYLGDHPPVRVFAHGVTQVAAGSHHVCAIVSGALWCWGDNSHGQVGLGYSIEHAGHSPTTPPYDPRKRGTFPDRDQTCFWQAWKDLACRVEHPVEVIAYGVTAAFARGDETCALASRALMCWGYNGQGQLGIASAEKDVLKPTVAIPLGATSVALSRERTCAVMKDGALRCTLPCTKNGDALKCPQHPGFVAGDPTDMSGIEARVGVWRGRIGNSKVMVCLERPDTLNESMYYYLRHRFSIRLHANDDSGATWNEAPPNERAPDWSKPAAIWTLHAPVGYAMDGTWATADGSRKAPIRLTRVADAATSLATGCAAMDDSPARLAFNAPRVASQELSVSQSSDGFRTISVLGGNVSMTELPDSMPHAARFNATMRAWLADKIAGYYECASSSFDGIPDYSETYEIDLLSPPWLIARHNWSGFCGGAHPSSEADYTTWNMATGKTVNPWDFLKDSHWDYIKEVNHCDSADTCLRRPPPKLGQIIATRFRHDTDQSDCADAIDENLDYLQLHPEKTGLVFSTTFAHVIQACDEDIELPWKTLMPFLTVQGKAAMRSLGKVAGPNGAAKGDATSEDQRP